MARMFVVHIRPYPAESLVIGLLYNVMNTTIELGHSNSHEAENTEYDKRMAHKRFDTLMNGFVVMVTLHIFVLMFYKYYNNKTLAFCQFCVFSVLGDHLPGCGTLKK